MVQVLYVPKVKLTEIVPQLIPFIQRAFEYSQGEYTFEDVIDSVLDDRMQLWGVVDDERGIIGAFTTHIVEYPRLRVLKISNLGGDRFMDWGEKLDEEMVRFGKKQGCQMLQYEGRPGWAKVGPLAGHEQQYIVMGKRIDE